MSRILCRSDANDLCVLISPSLTVWFVVDALNSCSVHIEFPKIEVRYEDLTVDAYVHVGSRALPTIPNFICNMSEVAP